MRDLEQINDEILMNVDKLFNVMKKDGMCDEAMWQIGFICGLDSKRQDALRANTAIPEKDVKTAKRLFGFDVQQKEKVETETVSGSWDGGAIGGSNLLGDDYNRIRSEDKPIGAPFHDDD